MGHFYFAQIGHSHFAPTSLDRALTAYLPATKMTSMSSAVASAGLLPEDSLLIRQTEESLVVGLQLADWLRDHGESLEWKPIDLGRPFRLPHTQACHLGRVKVEGGERTVMATRQLLEFGSLGSRTRDALRDYVLGSYVPTSHWTNQDGTPGGILPEQILYRRPGGEYGRFPESARQGGGDFRELGSKYDWVLLTITPYDLVMDLTVFRLRIFVVPYLVIHPGYVHVVQNPSPGYSLEVTVGYSYIDASPIALRPWWVGYGPGRFVAATKIYQFLVTDNNEIRVRMYFAAAPRSQKILDFGKSWPDPVYGPADALHWLTFGLFPSGRVHDFVDTQITRSHCQLTQALVEGAQVVWSGWRSGSSGSGTPGGA
jgi:hypothetical protein